jgi:CubicO group peptidase (beta-lactamase class C family)
MRNWLLLGVILLGGAIPAAAQVTANSEAGALGAGVDAVVDEWLTDTAAPSVSIAIVQRGRPVYAKAYGHARLQPSVAATTTTRYAIDSVSKEFTAAAILLLAQQGKLSLDDPVSRWFPALGAAAQATLRQLLTHTSGIRDYWPQDFLPAEMTHPTSTAAIIDEWVKRPLDFAPGTDWQYSNTGYVLAGAVVQKVSDETLFEFLRRHIFAPLDMAHVAEYAAPLPSGDAEAYTRYGLGPIYPAPREGAGWLFAAAGLAMSPSELALWDISLIDRSLLGAKSYEQEFEPVALQNGAQQDYGLGLEVEQTQGRLRIGHSGSGSGFLADHRVWPKERTAIVVLTNNDWASPSELLDRIAFVVLPPTPEEARARAVFEGFQRGTVNKSLFTDTGLFYLTASVLADLQSSLAPLGPARLIELERQSRRGGMVTRRWKILCRGARLEATERGYPNGKLDEFMIARKED